MSTPNWLANPVATVEFHSVRPELLPVIRAGARKGRGTVTVTAEYRGASTKTVIVEFAGDGLQDRRSAFLDSLSPLRIVPDILNPNLKSLQPSNA